MRSRLSSPVFICVAAVLASTAVSAQTFDMDKAIVLSRDASRSFRLIERSDWARYDNGKYTGHVYRETRGNLAPKNGSAAASEYAGDFYIMEETLRDSMQSARAVDDVYTADFKLSENGTLLPVVDNGFPTLRGFPHYPEGPVLPGQKWTGRFDRAVDPRNDGKVALLPLIAEYQYMGEERYKGTPVHHVFAKYATRYRGRPASQGKLSLSSSRKPGVPAFSEASGTHEVDIVIDAASGVPLLLRDRLDETFTYPDGSTLRYKGFTLTFAEGFSLLERDSVIAALKGGGNAQTPGAPPAANAPAPSAPPRPAPDTPESGAAQAQPEAEKTSEPPPAAASEPEPIPIQAGTEGDRAPAAPFELADAGTSADSANIGVEETPAGVKLTVRDLRFVPDSDSVIPGERGRLELIARSLKAIPGKTFLVEGHTAAVGKAAGELELSQRRAKRVVDELVARGIPADRFIYKGWGGTKPLAGNDTDDGRAKNRRVEITILD